MPSFLALLGLGFLLGVRHATDVDHVVAVTTIVSRRRSLGLAGSAMVFPLARIAVAQRSIERLLVRVTGIASVALGLFLAYRIGVVDGLLFGTPKWTPE